MGRSLWSRHRSRSVARVIEPSRTHEFRSDCVGAPTRLWRDFKFLPWRTFNASVRHLCRPGCVPDTWTRGRLHSFLIHVVCVAVRGGFALCFVGGQMQPDLCQLSQLAFLGVIDVISWVMTLVYIGTMVSLRSVPLQPFHPSSCRNLLSLSLASLPLLAVIVLVYVNRSVSGRGIIRPLSSVAAGPWWPPIFASIVHRMTILFVTAPLSSSLLVLSFLPLLLYCWTPSMSVQSLAIRKMRITKKDVRRCIFRSCSSLGLLLVLSTWRPHQMECLATFPMLPVRLPPVSQPMRFPSKSMAFIALFATYPLTVVLPKTLMFSLKLLAVD